MLRTSYPQFLSNMIHPIKNYPGVIILLILPRVTEKCALVSF